MTRHSFSTKKPTRSQGKSDQLEALIVEDSKEYALLINEYLSDAKSPQFKTTIAYNFSNATNLLKTNSYHLIVLDLHLPDRMGFQTFKEFHSQPSARHTDSATDRSK